MRRWRVLSHFFPKQHGKPRVDDRRVLSGIIFINRNDLRWRDAPKEYGPHKTLFNRCKRWSEKSIFAQMMAGLAEGLAALGNLLRQLPQGLPIRHRPCSNRHLLAMSPDPNLAWS